MKPALRRALAASLLLLAPLLPAQADTTSFPLTGTWQKIASAGTSVDVQNNNGAGYAVLSTSQSGSPSGVAGQAIGPGEHRLYSLSSDLYAFGTVPILVTTGLGGTVGTASNPSVASDPNNASYTAWPAITPGTAFAAPRGIWASCTAAGTTTLTDAGGNTLPWSLGIGSQFQPMAAVNLTAVTGCSFARLN